MCPRYSVLGGRKRGTESQKVKEKYMLEEGETGQQ